VCVAATFINATHNAREPVTLRVSFLSARCVRTVLSCPAVVARDGRLSAVGDRFSERFSATASRPRCGQTTNSTFYMLRAVSSRGKRRLHNADNRRPRRNGKECYGCAWSYRLKRDEWRTVDENCGRPSHTVRGNGMRERCSATVAVGLPQEKPKSFRIFSETFLENVLRTDNSFPFCSNEINSLLRPTRTRAIVSFHICAFIRFH